MAFAAAAAPLNHASGGPRTGLLQYLRFIDDSLVSNDVLFIGIFMYWLYYFQIRDGI